MSRVFISLIIPLLLLCCEQPKSQVIQPPPQEEVTQDDASEPDDTVSLLDIREEDSQARIDKFTIRPPVDDNFISFGNYRTPKPPSWFWVPPKSQIVTCNYVVPSVDESEHALFSVTQFRVGEGGHFTDNVTRWKSLFRSNAGAPVKPKIDVITVNNHEAVIAVFTGEYMGAGAAWHLKNHSLMVVEVREPDGNIYFKLLGPTSTVNAHRHGFLKALDNLELLPSTP